MELTLPDQPPLLARVVSTLSDPCADVHSMARCLVPTPELSHAFVRLANTFGRRGRVSCATEAILELGPRASKQLILCLATKKHLSATASNGLALDAFWLASLRRAHAAHVLGSTLGIANDLSLFSVGFHQDIGVLLRAQQDASAAQTLSDLAEAPALRRLRVERCFGSPHDEVSFAFCRRWALAAEIAVPIRYHHQPEQAPAAHSAAALIAHAGESIADLPVTSEIPPVWALAERALASLRLDAQLPKLFDQVADLVDDTAEAFGIDAPTEARFAAIRDRTDPRQSGMRVSHSAAERELLNASRENGVLRARLARAGDELAATRDSRPPSGTTQIEPAAPRNQSRKR